MAQETPSPTPKRRKIWSLLGICLLLAGTAALLIALLRPREPGERKRYMDPEGVAARCMNAMLDPQFQDMILLLPEEVQAKLFPDADASLQWAAAQDNEIHYLYQHLRETYDYWDIRYELGERTDMSPEQLAQWQQYYAEQYACHIEAGLIITADMSITLNDETSIKPLTIYLISIDGCWYLDADHSESILNFFLPFPGVPLP